MDHGVQSTYIEKPFITNKTKKTTTYSGLHTVSQLLCWMNEKYVFQVVHGIIVYESTSHPPTIGVKKRKKERKKK